MDLCPLCSLTFRCNPFCMHALMRSCIKACVNIYGRAPSAFEVPAHERCCAAVDQKLEAFPSRNRVDIKRRLHHDFRRLRGEDL